MKKAGTADLPLHYGKVPSWLYERMSKLGLSIIETILMDYGKDEVLKRLADPFWFQSFGAVLGMDWHSSGITTSVMGALKRAINPNSQYLGLYICGGKGKLSRGTPQEILQVSDRTGIDGNLMVRNSKLVAKVDNTALQDGYQLYLHNFILSDQGKWSVVQQGMHTFDRTARRYHWHSDNIKSFVDEPHSAIQGTPQGNILNLTASRAAQNRNGILSISRQDPHMVIKEFRSLLMPKRHHLESSDVDLGKLGAMLYITREADINSFEDLLLLKGIGPRTMQSLALVSEVIHGAPCRFEDPARFSFAHGGKDGHPFPVPLKVYDQTIEIFQNGITRSTLGPSEKTTAIKRLHRICIQAENHFQPNFDLDSVIQKERQEAPKYGGRTVMGKSTGANRPSSNIQLTLF